MAMTRKARAYRLLQDAAKGPAGMTDEQRRNYNLWASTWILPKMVELMPELKGAVIRYATSEGQDEQIELPGYTTRL